MEKKMNDKLYDIPLNTLDGRPASLRDHADQVLLIVNVASRCGLTPQYEGLEKLHEALAPRGFQVLGFPCNDFAAQEPGTADEIREFCSATYGVSFPLFAKVQINSEPRHPIYAALIEAIPAAVYPEGSDFREKLAGYKLLPARDTDVLWNFEKFLIDRQGKVIGRFSPDTAPDDASLRAAIEAALG
jgi:glutathione peroxidase